MTNASIPIPFAIGQELWWVGNGHREEWITCPECAGSKALTLIQGNGEQVSLECANCSQGYEPPTGVILHTVYEHTPTRFIPRRLRMDGDDIHYSENSSDATWYRSVDAKDLFVSKDECRARCEALNIQRTKSDEQNAIHNLASKRRNMAWSVHYWGQKVKQLERDLEMTKRRLAVSREKEASKEAKKGEEPPCPA